jgi:hypothetical protein
MHVRSCPRHVAPKCGQAHEPEVPRVYNGDIGFVEDGCEALTARANNIGNHVAGAVLLGIVVWMVMTDWLAPEKRQWL